VDADIAIRQRSHMIHLIYISSATREMSEDDLVALLRQSRERNEKQDITGMLLFKDGLFLQVLEGSEKDVDEIYRSICLDERNAGNYLIERKAIDERNFPDWRMGFENLSNRNLGDQEGFSAIFNNDLAPEEIAKNRDLAVKLILSFKNA
jgi:hypothetical protein